MEQKRREHEASIKNFSPLKKYRSYRQVMSLAL